MKFLDKIGLAKLWEHITALFSTRVPQTRKINNKTLETDITLNYADLEGSIPSDSLPTAGANPGAVKTGGVATIENGVITKVSEATKVSKTLTVGSKTYDGSTAVSISAADLGLSAAMKFLGTSTTAVTDGATTNPVTVGGASTTVTAGNVVLYGSKEFVWNGSSWEELGNEGSYKVVQSAVSSPATSGNATAFIDTISQDTNGKITATKKNVTFPTLSGGASASADATVAGGVTVSGHAVTVAKKTLTPGNNVQITGDATKITISATDTTYGNATTTSAGLMSAADKTALDKVVSDMGNIDYPVDSVNGKTGAVKLTATDVGAEVAGAVETHAGNTTLHTNATERSNLATAYAHANAKGVAKTSGLYKITTNSEGHVTAATAVTKADITGLGIPAQDTTYTLPAAGTDLGGVKSGGDVSISNGVITVNNNSHTHSVENITGLEDRLSEIEDNLTFPVTSVNAKTGDVVLTASDVGADAAGAANTALTNAKSYTDSAVSGKVDKVSGKGLSTNDYTTTEKTKLANISEGAEVNQNAFSNVVVGSTTIAADSKTDTLTLVAGANITLTPDASGDKITIAGASHENTTYSAGTGLKMDGTTINHSNSVTAKTTYNQATAAPGYGGTFKITEPKYDAQGHVTGTQVATITMPSAQTIPTSLKNPNALTIGSKTYDGSSAITINASDLGLSNALHFIGTASSLPASGTNGDVVLVGNKEYVYSDGWVELGDGDSHALKTVQIKAGSGLTGGGAISGDVTLSHGDTSSVTNVTASGRKYVTGLTFDTYGHVTGVTTGTETVINTDTNTTYDLAASVSSSNGNVKLNLTAGGSGSGTDSVTFKGSGATTVTTDANGVVTISSTDNNTNYYHTAAFTSGVKLATGTGVNDMYVPEASGTQKGVTIVYPAAQCTTFTSDSGTVTPLAVKKAVETFGVLNTGDSISGNLVFSNPNATSQAQHPTLTWNAIGANTPYIGYTSDQTDGTFIIGSIKGTSYTSGLAIGGGSGNLLWKGKRVLTVDDVYSLPTATASTLGGVKIGSNISVSSGTISLTEANVTAALGYTPPTADTGATTVTVTGTGNAITSASYDATSRTITLTKGATYNNYTYTLPTASSSTLGGVKTTSTVTSTSGLTACPIISGVPYYKDTNTTYTLPAATSSALGGVKIGSNITNTSGTISLTKDNVVAALGYTPPTTDTNTDTGATSVEVTGTGNAVTAATYDASTRKLTLTKGATYNNYSLPADISVTTVTASGAVTGSAFNSSGAANISNIEFKGSSSHGGYIDFHYGQSTADYTTRLMENASGALNCTGTFTATKVYGAVWNDYAEYRKAEILEAGRVVVESRDGVMKMANERLLPACEIVSDTFGFGIGETDECKTPIACSGRVLAYTYEDRDEFELGDAVCSGPNGTVSRMTREEIREYPERIIGTVSEIPTYEVWGTGDVKVNGRIWIRIR